MELLDTLSGPVVGSSLGAELARIAGIHALGLETPLDHQAEFTRDVTWVRDRDLNQVPIDFDALLRDQSLPLNLTALVRAEGELPQGPPYSARIQGATAAERSGPGKPVAGYGHSPAEAIKTLTTAVQGRTLIVDGRSIPMPARISARQMMAEMDACTHRNEAILRAARQTQGSLTATRAPDGSWRSHFTQGLGAEAPVVEHSGGSFGALVAAVAETAITLGGMPGLRPLLPLILPAPAQDAGIEPRV